MAPSAPGTSTSSPTTGTTCRWAHGAFLPGPHPKTQSRRKCRKRALALRARRETRTTTPLSKSSSRNSPPMTATLPSPYTTPCSNSWAPSPSWTAARLCAPSFPAGTMRTSASTRKAASWWTTRPSPSSPRYAASTATTTSPSLSLAPPSPSSPRRTATSPTSSATPKLCTKTEQSSAPASSPTSSPTCASGYARSWAA